jgi:hypothetical protein
MIYSRYFELCASYPQLIACHEERSIDAPIVHERPVRALEILDNQLAVAGSEAAVQARDQRLVDDKIRRRRPAHRLDGASADAEHGRICLTTSTPGRLQRGRPG